MLTFERAASWCRGFLCIVLGTVVGVAAVNYTVNFYSVFRSSERAGVRLYSNERMGKYLLGMRYIPDQFNGILIGSSVSENWPLHQVGGVRIYNASLSGGNISEEKLIADNVLAHGHIALAVFCIHPYLTATHGTKTSYMTSQDYWAALGSLPLFREYAGALLAHAGIGGVLVDEYGISDAPPNAEAQAVRARRLAALKSGATPLQVDTTAFAEYASLLESARAHGAKIVGFVPPLYAPDYLGQMEEMRAYVARVKTLFAPGEMVVDFTAPEYAAYSLDRGLFLEGVHLRARAAGFFSRELAGAIARSSPPDSAAH
jgi:hypothetical protein